MRCLALSLTVLVAASCAGHKPNVAPPVTMRYVFVETLTDDTQLCVQTNPFVTSVSCMALGEFRDLVRGIKRASIHTP